MICLKPADYDLLQGALALALWVAAGAGMIAGGCLWEFVRQLLGRDTS